MTAAADTDQIPSPKSAWEKLNNGYREHFPLLSNNGSTGNVIFLATLGGALSAMFSSFAGYGNDAWRPVWPATCAGALGFASALPLSYMLDDLIRLAPPNPALKRTANIIGSAAIVAAAIMAPVVATIGSRPFPTAEAVSPSVILHRVTNKIHDDSLFGISETIRLRPTDKETSARILSQLIRDAREKGTYEMPTITRQQLFLLAPEMFPSSTVLEYVADKVQDDSTVVTPFGQSYALAHLTEAQSADILCTLITGGYHLPKAEASSTTTTSNDKTITRQMLFEAAMVQLAGRGSE